MAVNPDISGKDAVRGTPPSSGSNVTNGNACRLKAAFQPR